MRYSEGYTLHISDGCTLRMVSDAPVNKLGIKQLKYTVQTVQSHI